MEFSMMCLSRSLTACVLGLGALLMSGCDARSGVDPAPPPAIDQHHQQPTRAIAVEIEPSELLEGMAYADLRSRIADGGWAPTVDPGCRANVVGANYADVCNADPAACGMCDALPELASCSGDGHCLMHFQRAGRTLTVSTYGELADWNVRGAMSRLTVKWWDSGASDAPTDAR